MPNEWLAGCAVLVLSGTALAQQRTAPPPAADPEIVSFPSSGRTLRGYLYRPAGAGPFPAVVWNHGISAKRAPEPNPLAKLGAYYREHGYVLFLPHRRGFGLSPGEYFEDVLVSAKPAQRDAVMGRLLEEHQEDVQAAVRYVKSLPFVASDRIVMAGLSHGGIQTVLAAGVEGLGIRAAITFGAGAHQWDRHASLREKMTAAVRRLQVPLFMLQAENDPTHHAIEALGQALKSTAVTHRTTMYPAFGDTPEEAHAGFACRGMSVWGKDVLAFIEEALNPAKPTTRAPRVDPNPATVAPRVVELASEWMRSGTWNPDTQSWMHIKHLNPVDHTDEWDYRCLAFVRSVSAAAGLDVEDLWAVAADNPDNRDRRADPGKVGAQAAFERLRAAGKIQPISKQIPAGATVFWVDLPGYAFGHVAIFTGEYTPEGSPMILTTGGKAHPGIALRSLAIMDRFEGAKAAGWALLGTRRSGQ